MREFKFRSWNNGFVFFDLIEDNDCDFYRFYCSAGDIVEQYTGLKDKNGKEIYEGDIVTMNLECEELEPDDCELISFSDGCFRVGNGYEDEAGFYLQDWRVVGNIHENKELLK